MRSPAASSCLLLTAGWVNGRSGSRQARSRVLAHRGSQHGATLLGHHRAAEEGEIAELGALLLAGLRGCVPSPCGTVQTLGLWSVQRHSRCSDTSMLSGFVPDSLCRWGAVLVLLRQFKCSYCSVKSVLFRWSLSFTRSNAGAPKWSLPLSCSSETDSNLQLKNSQRAFSKRTAF